jgi:hypothetical protein
MRVLTELEMSQVGGGGESSSCCCPEPKRKGNNGWGNGAEGTNAGSFSGGTAGSKSDEVWNDGDGPKPKKHDYR